MYICFPVENADLFVSTLGSCWPFVIVWWHWDVWCPLPCVQDGFDPYPNMQAWLIFLAVRTASPSCVVPTLAGSSHCCVSIPFGQPKKTVAHDPTRKPQPGYSIKHQGLSAQGGCCVYPEFVWDLGLTGVYCWTPSYGLGYPNYETSDHPESIMEKTSCVTLVI